MRGVRRHFFRKGEAVAKAAQGVSEEHVFRLRPARNGGAPDNWYLERRHELEKLESA